MKSKDKLRVIVCGVGFGQFYLEAIEKLKSKYKIVGIFSRGSESSKKLSEKCDVPLYTNLDEINKENVDIACVVIKSTIVGGKGSDIVTELLNKGINVIQEQPVHIEEYKKFLVLAKDNNCSYKLNTFYPELEKISDFIKLTNKLNNVSQIRYINAECSIHVLFPLIDILGRILRGLRPWAFEKISSFDLESPFCIASGYINNVPICINIQNQIEPKNPENSMLLLHRINVITNSGTMILTGTNGIIVWEPCMSKKLDENGDYDIRKDDIFKSLKTYEIYNYTESETYKDTMLNQWSSSLEISLSKFYKEVFYKEIDNSEKQYLFSAIQAWGDLAKIIKAPCIIEEYDKKAISLKKLI